MWNVLYSQSIYFLSNNEGHYRIVSRVHNGSLNSEKWFCILCFGIFLYFFFPLQEDFVDCNNAPHADF